MKTPQQATRYQAEKTYAKQASGYGTPESLLAAPKAQESKKSLKTRIKTWHTVDFAQERRYKNAYRESIKKESATESRDPEIPSTAPKKGGTKVLEGECVLIIDEINRANVSKVFW